MLSRPFHDTLRLLAVLALFAAPPASAQQFQIPAQPRSQPPAQPKVLPQPPGQAQPPGLIQPLPGQPVVAPPNSRITNPVAVFAGLDKITGRIISFDVYMDETVQFGALQVTPRACYSRPPTEAPKTDAFVEVDEITLNRKVQRVFSGWMFAASPGLHAVDNAVYDVWLTDCRMTSAVAPPAKR
jgi:hypothetical protein